MLYKAAIKLFVESESFSSRRPNFSIYQRVRPDGYRLPGREAPRLLLLRWWEGVWWKLCPRSSARPLSRVGVYCFSGVNIWRQHTVLKPYVLNFIDTHKSARPKLLVNFLTINCWLVCVGDIGNYYYGQGHPMKPHRIRMTHNLLLNYGLYRKMEIYVSVQRSGISLGLRFWWYRSFQVHVHITCDFQSFFTFVPFTGFSRLEVLKQSLNSVPLGLGWVV